MPRPHALSPTNILIKTTRALTPWFDAHRDALLVEVGDEPLGAQAQEWSEELDRAESEYVRERLESKDATTQRDNTIREVQVFAAGLRASTSRRLQDHPNAARLVQDFRFPMAARARSTDDATRLLRDIQEAIRIHAAALDQSTPRSAQWQEQAARLMRDLDAHEDRLSKESAESKAARQRRDELKRRCDALLENATLAAQSVAVSNPAPLDALRAIFDAHNPAPNAAPSPSEEGDEPV